MQKVVAIGEIGLDYHYEGYDREAQIKVFREQIVLANELSLPIIVHCRDAVGDCMDILRELKPKGVMALLFRLGGDRQGGYISGDVYRLYRCADL